MFSLLNWFILLTMVIFQNLDIPRLRCIRKQPADIQVLFETSGFLRKEGQQIFPVPGHIGFSDPVGFLTLFPGLFCEVDLRLGIFNLAAGFVEFKLTLFGILLYFSLCLGTFCSVFFLFTFSFKPVENIPGKLNSAKYPLALNCAALLSYISKLPNALSLGRNFAFDDFIIQSYASSDL
jgi:hypothetical protein